MFPKRIVVIGGGVIGLSSAVKLAEYYKASAEVTVVAQALSPNTTGDGSAGLWGPYLLGSTPSYKVAKWAKETHDFFRDLWCSETAPEVGACLQPMLRLTSESDTYDAPWKDIVYGFQELSKTDLNRLNSEYSRNYTAGVHFISFTCEPVFLLPYLFKRFLAAGGKFMKRKVIRFDDFPNADLVVNCTGLGAKRLAEDNEMMAIRGHVVRVKAPWIFKTILDDSDDGNYIIPNCNSVILGGTHQPKMYARFRNTKDTVFIIDGCTKMIPSLKNAENEKHWVGLRPGRDSVRLEADAFIASNGRKVNLIHNYGHGGSGVTLSWGCASDVLEIAKQKMGALSKL